MLQEQKLGAFRVQQMLSALARIYKTLQQASVKCLSQIPVGRFAELILNKLKAVRSDGFLGSFAMTGLTLTPVIVVISIPLLHRQLGLPSDGALIRNAIAKSQTRPSTVTSPTEIWRKSSAMAAIIEGFPQQWHDTQKSPPPPQNNSNELISNGSQEYQNGTDGSHNNSKQPTASPPRSDASARSLDARTTTRRSGKRLHSHRRVRRRIG